MLAANEAVARELKNRSIPTIYRVHENPEPDKLAEYRELVLSYNYKAGDLTNRTELQRLLASLAGKPEEQALKIGLLKSLKRARYAPQPLGHYGLAKNNYTHFTSPIRRYADLVVHRALAERDQARRSRADMGQIAADRGTHLDHGTRRRRGRDRLRENEEARVLSAPARRARSAGLSRDSYRRPELWTRCVELPDVLLTGLVHVSSLTDDFYVFHPTQRRFIGRQSRRRFSVGDQLRVFVARVDIFKRQVDFAIANGTAPKRERTRSRQPASRARRR